MICRVYWSLGARGECPKSLTANGRILDVISYWVKARQRDKHKLAIKCKQIWTSSALEAKT